MEAALQLAEENENVQGVTISLEAVAHRAGITKPGLMYHFPTKAALMEGVVRSASLAWHRELTRKAGAEPEDLSVWERYRSYVHVATELPLTRADYWVFTDALYHARLTHGWKEHLDPWLDVSGVPGESRTLLFAARFMVDGAWMSGAIGFTDAAEVRGVQPHALTLIDQAEALTPNSAGAR